VRWGHFVPGGFCPVFGNGCSISEQPRGWLAVGRQTADGLDNGLCVHLTNPLDEHTPRGALGGTPWTHIGRCGSMLWFQRRTIGWLYLIIVSLKVKRYSSQSPNKTSQSYGMSVILWDHTLLPATLNNWTHPALTSAGTRFTYAGGMEGWVGLGGWVWRPAYQQQSVTHSSTNRARCRATTLIETNVIQRLHHAATSYFNDAMAISRNRNSHLLANSLPTVSEKVPILRLCLAVNRIFGLNFKSPMVGHPSSTRMSHSLSEATWEGQTDQAHTSTWWRLATVLQQNHPSLPVPFPLPHQWLVSPLIFVWNAPIGRAPHPTPTYWAKMKPWQQWAAGTTH